MNVWISALAAGWYPLILDALRDGRLALIVSRALLAELRDVAARPRLRKWFDPADAEDLALALEAEARVVEPTVGVTACRDPDDNYLLALAETAAADYLVSRDEDLLSLGRWKATTIIHPAGFMQILAGGPSSP